VERHVDLLGMLARLWGALVMLAGVSLLLLAGGAMAELLDPVGTSVGLAAGLTAAAFAVLGVFAVVWGALHLLAAQWLKQRKPAGRMLMLALALTNLLVLPFGTALGGYALWALLTNEGRHLFESPA
jgi:threonine/homoserine efflux transporter RhtA